MIYHRLKELEDAGKAANVGLIGTGTFGSQIVARDDSTPVERNLMPQHFIGLEMPLTIAHMVLDGAVTGTPIGQFSEVVCAAKKPLRAGETLDGEGGYCVYGLLEKAADPSPRGAGIRRLRPSALHQVDQVALAHCPVRVG